MTAINLKAFQTPAPKASAPASTDAARPDWQSLDISTLSPDLAESYHAYRIALDRANTLRKSFESAMCTKLDLPTHLTLAFGYKFGKLSVAIVPASPKLSSARPALSLAALAARIP